MRKDRNKLNKADKKQLKSKEAADFGGQPPNRSYIAKEILIGFLVTIACNLAGMYFYISAVSGVGIIKFLEISMERGFFTSIVGLGALLDFLAFFVFLKKRQFYRVRGVLLGVLVATAVVGFFLINGL